MRDAATSLQKLQFSKGGETGGKEGRRSFLFGQNNAKKRLSKQAEEEMDFSTRKISELEDEIARLSSRRAEIERAILQHHAGVLAYNQTVGEGGTSGGASGKSHQHTQSTDSGITSPVGRSGSPATARMLARRAVSGASTSGGGGVDDTAVSEALAKLSRAVGSQTPPQNGPTGRTERGQQLASLVDTLLNRLEAAESRADDADAKANTLETTIQDMVAHMDPEFDQREITSQRHDPRALRAAAIGATAAAALKLAEGTTGATGGGSETVGPDSHKVKTLLRSQLDSLTQSYEANRAELERLELANVDLKAELQESKFALQAKITELENELSASQERGVEWKERCDNLSTELESVVRSLEDVTRQAVDYESERTKLDQTVADLNRRLYESSQSTLDKRVSMIAAGPASGPTASRGLGGNTTTAVDTIGGQNQNEPLSVSILRHEFRRIVQEINDKHVMEIRREQSEKRKLESLLRSIKTSSYMNSIPPERLEALGIVDGLA